MTDAVSAVEKDDENMETKSITCKCESCNAKVTLTSENFTLGQAAGNAYWEAHCPECTAYIDLCDSHIEACGLTAGPVTID